jgi:hypothetical protein
MVKVFKESHEKDLDVMGVPFKLIVIRKSTVLVRTRPTLPFTCEENTTWLKLVFQKTYFQKTVKLFIMNQENERYRQNLYMIVSVMKN